MPFAIEKSFAHVRPDAEISRIASASREATERYGSASNAQLAAEASKLARAVNVHLNAVERLLMDATPLKMALGRTADKVLGNYPRAMAWSFQEVKQRIEDAGEMMDQVIVDSRDFEDGQGAA